MPVIVKKVREVVVLSMPLLNTSYAFMEENGFLTGLDGSNPVKEMESVLESLQETLDMGKRQAQVMTNPLRAILRSAPRTMAMFMDEAMEELDNTINKDLNELQLYIRELVGLLGRMRHDRRPQRDDFGFAQKASASGLALPEPCDDPACNTCSKVRKAYKMAEQTGKSKEEALREVVMETLMGDAADFFKATGRTEDEAVPTELDSAMESFMERMSKARPNKDEGTSLSQMPTALREALGKALAKAGLNIDGKDVHIIDMGTMSGYKH